MLVLVTWLSSLCCFVAPYEGHVELIPGEPRPLFISDPVLCQLDRAPCMCGSKESVVKFIWLGLLSGETRNVPILKSRYSLDQEAN